MDIHKNARLTLVMRAELEAEVSKLDDIVASAWNGSSRAIEGILAEPFVTALHYARSFA